MSSTGLSHKVVFECVLFVLGRLKVSPGVTRAYWQFQKPSRNYYFLKSAHKLVTPISIFVCISMFGGCGVRGGALCSLVLCQAGVSLNIESHYDNT